MKEKFISEKQIRSRILFSFFVFICVVSIGIYGWVHLREQNTNKGIPATLRKGLDVNESIFSSLFSKTKLAKTYPVSLAEKRVRVNGDIGLKEKTVDTAVWRMQVIRNVGDTLLISLADLERLPKTEIVFDFKCIEGWDQKTWWGGVRFSDFIKYYHLNEQAKLNYAGLNTPDKAYYVGIDMASMMHPQTILCYQMNGKLLPYNQGYPVRLIIPVKYGIKHLKRIGTLYFSNDRPPDYWAERGYDYYAGH